MVYAGQCKYYIDLYYLNFERKWAYYTLFSKKKHLKRGIFNVLSTYKTFADPIKVICWPHVARGPDVAQACSIWSLKQKKFCSGIRANRLTGDNSTVVFYVKHVTTTYMFEQLGQARNRFLIYFCKSHPPLLFIYSSELKPTRVK